MRKYFGLGGALLVAVAVAVLWAAVLGFEREPIRVPANQPGLAETLSLTLDGWETTTAVQQEYGDPVRATPGSVYVMVALEYQNPVESEITCYARLQGSGELEWHEATAVVPYETMLSCAAASSEPGLRYFAFEVPQSYLDRVSGVLVEVSRSDVDSMFRLRDDTRLWFELPPK
jgi:hypothetical protein